MFLLEKWPPRHKVCFVALWETSCAGCGGPLHSQGGLRGPQDVPAAAVTFRQVPSVLVHFVQ
jgi:hypothetical protein